MLNYSGLENSADYSQYQNNVNQSVPMGYSNNVTSLSCVNFPANPFYNNDGYHLDSGKDVHSIQQTTTPQMGHKGSENVKRFSVNNLLQLTAGCPSDTERHLGKL